MNHPYALFVPVANRKVRKIVWSQEPPLATASHADHPALSPEADVLASSSQQSLGITTYGVFESSARWLPEAVNDPPSEFLGAFVGVGLGNIGVPRWRNPVFRLVSSVAFPLSERLACSFEFALGLGLSIASAFSVPALESLCSTACRAFGFLEGIGGFVRQRPFTSRSFGKGTGSVGKLVFGLSALPKLVELG